MGPWRLEEFTPLSSEAKAQGGQNHSRQTDRQTGLCWCQTLGGKQVPRLNVTLASKAVLTEDNLHTTECLQLQISNSACGLQAPEHQLSTSPGPLKTRLYLRPRRSLCVQTHPDGREAAGWEVSLPCRNQENT